MPSNDRPIRFTERSSFTITLAILVSLVTGSLTAGAAWSTHKSAVSDHEARIQRVEAKLEDVASIKTDVAVIKAILERLERRQSVNAPGASE